jgi:midasin
MALANMAGVPLTRINLSDQTELIDLFGSDVPIDGAHAGNFGWRDAPFLRAMQNGGWVLLDEMNLASQTVLEGLNGCFDHRGQVYISELGRTFTRHPRFTVFAAQNPHHQGGGRKGLPASFVNRFTVVYTDPLTAGDLLMICSHCYPQDSAQSVESLVRCVTDVGEILHTDNEMNAHGGPWEINLRDLFRWLNLLHSDDLVTSAGNAVDYEDLVFLQRFRNPGNVTAVMKVLEKHLPQAKKNPSFIHNMTSSYLQVGFALIQRHPLATPVLDRRLKQVSLNLRLLESALLCIKNAWPCLLVGPSGSGKTSLVLQLASYLGTDVVNLPLNADMDTMDLIGGYEQLDVQRHRMTLLEKLRQETRSIIAAHLVSGPNMDLDVLKLEEKLREEMPDLKEIVNLSRRLENLYPNWCYSYITTECEKISHLQSKDNAARFEWVDGLLVKALKQGHWLVLDNANLCSSSILDRLNALLEPDGFLSINEHCTADGSAHIVKPHQNFRLFLTIDPRHGELSRAMRNRCTEIYMPTELLGSTQLLGTVYEPSISHFQVFDMINWTALDDARLHELSSLCSDFLTVSDYMLCHRWQGELTKGLLGIPPIIQSRLVSDLNIRHDILSYGGSIISTIQAVYGELAVKLGFPPDFKQKQVSLYELGLKRAVLILISFIVFQSIGQPRSQRIERSWRKCFRSCNARRIT